MKMHYMLYYISTVIADVNQRVLTMSTHSKVAMKNITKKDKNWKSYKRTEIDLE